MHLLWVRSHSLFSSDLVLSYRKLKQTIIIKQWCCFMFRLVMEQRLALRHEVVASTQQDPSVSRMKTNSAHTSYSLFPVLISIRSLWCLLPVGPKHLLQTAQRMGAHPCLTTWASWEVHRGKKCLVTSSSQTKLATQAPAHGLHAQRGWYTAPAALHLHEAAYSSLDCVQGCCHVPHCSRLSSRDTWWYKTCPGKLYCMHRNCMKR